MDTTSNGGTTAFSAATDVVDVNVTAVNDAPVLADTALSLTVLEDAGAPSGAVGSLVSTFTGGLGDVDSGADKGIAITASDETNGAWHYSTDGGTHWAALGVVSNASSLLLADNASTRLYFAPSSHYNGTSAAALTLRAWDQTSGSAGSKVDTTTNGATTAFGAATDVVDVTVIAVNDVPSGLPAITGSVTEDQTLTADTSAIADADVLGTFAYQWLRNGVAVGGASASTYTLGDADVGAAMSVTVSWTDSGGTAESLTSAATAAVANINDTPTGLPTISGTATEDQTLTVDTSSIADADGTGSFSYQWLRGGVAVSGATASTYTLGDADVAAPISVQVSWTDGYSTAEALTSATVGPVTNVNDAPGGTPTISGTPSEDQTLTAVTSSLADSDGLGALAYQWLRNGAPIGGATSSTYVLGDTDVGANISLQVSWTDTHGTAESLTSVAVGPVSNINDVPTGLPTISGTATEDQTLTAVTGSLADADGLGSFSYQWLRGGSAIAGAAASTYTLGDADVGANIGVQVSWTDLLGTAESLTSADLGPVANVNDSPTGAPTVTGTATEDQTLMADTSSIADADGMGALSYQWLRGGVAIGGATAATYTLGDADVGASISVQVGWTDARGTAESLTSAAVGPVANVNDTPTGAPAISGVATEDQTLTAVTGSIADIDGMGALSYQWLRNGASIGGATASTYTLGDADVGTNISVQVRWTDGQGTAEALTSASVGPVANVNDVPTGAPTISGTPTENQTLTAVTATIADADGLGPLAYQWLRGGVAISGATTSSHLLGDADVGANISVQVSWTDSHGTAESLTSVAAGPVANVNDAPGGTPTINGTTAEDQTLTADTSSIGDADGLGAFAYRWMRNGLNMAGATSGTLVLGDAEVGATISVQVSWLDGNGSAESLTSAGVGPVANVNDAPTGAPTISGTQTEDQTLTVDTSAVADADGLGALSYQWLRGGSVIAGASAATYTLGDADVGATISVQVGWADDNGSTESLTSALVGPVANVNDVPTGVPTISGTATEDQTLIAVTSGIADADGMGAISYQWMRDGALIAGATASTYSLSDADVGALISVQTSWTDGQGTAQLLTSAAVGPVANVNDLPTGAPTVSGTPTEDQTLTAVTSGLTDADGLGSLRYQWLRNNVAIAGATGASYTLGDADVGAQLQLRATYVDGQGTSETIHSALTGPVLNVNDAPNLLPQAQAGAYKWTVEENRDGVVYLTASDIDDVPQALSFSLTGGEDALQFSMDSATGQMRFLRTPDYEQAMDANRDSVYRVEVQVEDAQGGRTRQLIEVQVLDVNDAPQMAQPDDVELQTAPDNGTVVATAAATDQDTGDQLSYRLTDDAGGRFAVQPNSGEIVIADASAMRSVVEETYLLTVEVADSNGGVQRRILSIRVPALPGAPAPMAVPEAPQAATASSAADDVSRSKASMKAAIDSAKQGEALRDASAIEASTPKAEISAPPYGPRAPWVPAFEEATSARPEAAVLGAPPQREDASPAGAGDQAAPEMGLAAGDRRDLDQASSDLNERIRQTLSELGGRVWTSGARRASNSADDSAMDITEAAPADPAGAGALVLQLTDPATITGVGVSLSLVWWLTRAGGLLASSAMLAPAWRQMDLLALVNDRQHMPIRNGGTVLASKDREAEATLDLLGADLDRMLPPLVLD